LEQFEDILEDFNYNKIDIENPVITFDESETKILEIFNVNFKILKSYTLFRV